MQMITKNKNIKKIFIKNNYSILIKRIFMEEIKW